MRCGSARINGHIPRTLFIRDVRNLAVLCADSYRSDPTAHHPARVATIISRVGVSLDGAGVRYCWIGDQSEFVVGSPGSLIHRTGDHPAWGTILLLLAQTCNPR